MTDSAETTESREVSTAALLAGVGVALVLSAGALITAASGSAPASPADVPAAASADLPASMAVELTEMAIAPGQLEVAANGTMEITNSGDIAHDLVVDGTDVATPMIDPGDTATLDLASLDPGTHTVYCSVPGHRQAGMEATLVVGGGSSSNQAGDDRDHGTDTPSSTFAVLDPNQAPAEGFVSRNPVLEPAPGGTIHEITLEIEERVGEVAPGVEQMQWTFNGEVPGPTLRGKVGDVFRITLVNTGSMGHSIDFHASKVAPNVEMRTIEPGESLVYEFEAKHAGIWMYHCGTAPVLFHTSQGQYGALIVDPPDLDDVDHEYVFVQSEFYLGPPGELADYDKMVASDWDIVAFNGYANQYVHAPIDGIQVDERVRVWLLNAGPSENSSFHVIGTIFDTVYKEGSYRLHPDLHAPGGAQALDLQPAQGGFVEFTFDADGVYPFVTHKFANVPRGAVGLFKVGDVDGDASH